MMASTFVQRVIPVARRYSTQPAKEAINELEKQVVKESRKSGSSLGQRLAAFAVGCATGGGYGLYILKTDLQRSTSEIQDAVAALKADCCDHNENVSKRLAKLEKDFAKKSA